MKRLWLCALGMLGCASGDDPATTTATETGVDAAVDTRSPSRTDAAMDSIFAVDDTGPTGICATPKGTTVTANASYMTVPESAVDGTLMTGWNSGDYSGWIRLVFPTPTRFDRVRIAGNAVPACDETFTFKTADGALATATRSVTTDTNWLPEFVVPSGTYSELLVEVAPAASWIALAEIVVYESTAGCPPP